MQATATTPLSGDGRHRTHLWRAGDDFIGRSVLDNEVYTEGDELVCGDGDDTIETANGSTTGSTVYGGDGYDKIYDSWRRRFERHLCRRRRLGLISLADGRTGHFVRVADGASDDFIYGGEDGEVTGTCWTPAPVTADLVLTCPTERARCDTAALRIADPDNNNISPFDQIREFLSRLRNDTVFGGEGDDTVVDLGAGRRRSNYVRRFRQRHITRAAKRARRHATCWMPGADPKPDRHPVRAQRLAP